VVVYHHIMGLSTRPRPQAAYLGAPQSNFFGRHPKILRAGIFLYIGGGENFENVRLAETNAAYSVVQIEDGREKGRGKREEGSKQARKLVNGRKVRLLPRAARPSLMADGSFLDPHCAAAGKHRAKP
jgi:hypothetical protein